MRNVPKFQDVAAEFGDRADFYFVYITEAHPSDGWSFGKPAPAQQTTMEARVSTAEEWHAGLSDRSVPLLVDPIDDRVNDAFSARPERLFAGAALSTRDPISHSNAGVAMLSE